MSSLEDVHTSGYGHRVRSLLLGTMVAAAHLIVLFALGSVARHGGGGAPRRRGLRVHHSEHGAFRHAEALCFHLARATIDEGQALPLGQQVMHVAHRNVGGAHPCREGSACHGEGDPSGHPQHGENRAGRREKQRHRLEPLHHQREARRQLFKVGGQRPRAVVDIRLDRHGCQEVVKVVNVVVSLFFARRHQPPLQGEQRALLAGCAGEEIPRDVPVQVAVELCAVLRLLHVEQLHAAVL
eukprot:scaffold260698_cov31-Tisochrysis_lutea.AAC.1